MRSTVTKLEANRVSLEVEVDEQQVEKALDQAYKKVVKEVNIPGFRKGKAPRWILESRFGPEVLYEDAVDILMRQAYPQALDDNNLDPIAQPSVKVVQFEAGKPFIFTAEVELMPEVKLGEYKNLPVTKKVTKITDENVDQVLQEYRERMAELVTVDKEKVEDGDFVSIDFEGYIDGKPFSGGAGKNRILEIGSHTFIPGFEEGLIGAAVNEPVEVQVTFPENYKEELAGKEAVFKVTVKEIKEKRLPELDDEFAKDLGDFETLEDLKEDIRERLIRVSEEEAEGDAKDELVGKAVDLADIDVPKTLVDRAINYLMQGFNQELAYRGMNLEKYLEITGKAKSELQEEFRPRAERQVKTDLVLDAIAKAEGIEVSEEEVDTEIQGIAKSRGSEAARLVEQLNREDRRESIADRLRVSKVVDFLYNNAQVTEEYVDSHDKEEASEAQSE